jgi:hypothetical protein
MKARSVILLEIDETHTAFVNLLGHEQFKDAAIASLIDFGFNEKQISFDSSTQHAKKGDYLADLFVRERTITLIVSKVTTGRNVEITTDNSKKIETNILASSQIAQLMIACVNEMGR